MRRFRKIVMWLALVLMVLVIAGYAFVTDRIRVRHFVEQQLSKELSAKVRVGDARLSVFEGLRLDDVRVSAVGDEGPPVFEAKQIHVGYDPRALLGGKVAADRVVVVEPRVRLIEDLDHKRWNFQLLDHRGVGGAAGRPSSPMRALALPEVLVRNARFDYSQIENGRESNTSTLHLEGAFTPGNDGVYRFRVQSRGGADESFPVAEGSVKSDGSAVHVVVNDVQFVDEIKSILPAQVRRFWAEHELAGRLDELQLDWARKPDGHAGFRVATDWENISLIVPPTTWMGPGDKACVKDWHDAYTALGGPLLGRSAVSRSIVDAMTIAPLALDDVDARFVFTDKQVRIEKLRAHVGGNTLLFAGHIDGYSAESGVDLTVRSVPGSPLVLPKEPPFVAAMPWPVQEIYYRFRPIGTADLWLRVRRPAGVEWPTLSGELDVADARFVFDRLPYPVERATGTFRFGNDPVTGREMLEIVDVTGHGPVAGPNANAVLNVRGTISPLDETAGADIHVTGRDINAEPRLVQSLPPLTQHAVLNFDADRTGKLPTFLGDFGVDVSRTVGLGRPWTITTRLTLRDAVGKFKGFPYPLKNVSGSLQVFDDHVEIDKLVMPAGGGTGGLTGTVSWARHDPVTNEPLIQTDLAVTARGVAFDDDLLNALPASRRGELAKLGLTGRLDVDGTVRPAAPDSEEPAVDLSIKLKDGRAKPPAMPVTIDGLRVDVRVKGERADVRSFEGMLAGATITGAATADAVGDTTRVSADARVTALDVAQAPIDALPPDAAKAVRSLHAAGLVDANVHYESDSAYRVEVRPRRLSVTPDVLPLEFDATGGRVVVTPGRVTLDKLTADTGDASVSLGGTVDPVTGDADVSLAGRNLVIGPELTRALPGVLQEVIGSLALSGPIAVDCPKLVLRQPTTRPAAPARTVFDARLWLQKAKTYVGAEWSGVTGNLAVSGVVDGNALTRLDGKISADDATFAGRQVSRMSATLTKWPDGDTLRIGDINARIAGGQIAGRVDTLLNKKDPRFSLDLRVRGAKVGELTQDDAIDGTLDASLAMEGRWDDNRTRRGRGDVLVQGREMAKVPMVFGLMQIANLAVPNREPIRQAAMRYTVEGQRIRLDQIDLRSNQNVMAGDGMLDFDKKTVDLNLSLADSAADSLPIFGDLIKSARQDLLKLHLHGDLTAQSGGSGAFSIFNSDVKEVKDK